LILMRLWIQSKIISEKNKHMNSTLSFMRSFTKSLMISSKRMNIYLKTIVVSSKSSQIIWIVTYGLSQMMFKRNLRLDKPLFI